MSLKSREPVPRPGRLGQPDDGLGRQGFFVAQAHPIVGPGVLVGRRAVRQIGLGAIADEEQVPEGLNPVALPAVTEKRRHRYLEVLAQQIQHRRLDGGHRVYGYAQVERLRPPSTGVAVGERAPHVVEHGVVVADAAAGHDRAGILQGALDGFAARHLADAGVAVGVGEDHQVPGEERAVRTTEVQQHAVVAGDRNHRHLADNRNSHRILLIFMTQTICRRWPRAGPRETPCLPWCAARRRSRARGAGSVARRVLTR